MKYVYKYLKSYRNFGDLTDNSVVTDLYRQGRPKYKKFDYDKYCKKLKHKTTKKQYNKELVELNEFTLLERKYRINEKK